MDLTIKKYIWKLQIY